MIKHVEHGNLLKTKADAHVNTVNTVGFMGKGIALQFKKAYPDNFTAYERACKNDEVQVGKMFVFERDAFTQPRYIINFPTKKHWRAKSKLPDIKAGLEDLVRVVRELNIESIAIPPLGSGLGGLDWRDVRPLIEDAFANLPDVLVLLFEPRGAPDPKEQPVGTKRPKLTNSRALFIKLIHLYGVKATLVTLLEIQKMAYFLQEGGEPLRLNYQKWKYGPYAHNLYKVLELLEGHFIRGYGDQQRPFDDIELMPDAEREASNFLMARTGRQELLDRVADLIHGFETPYGMELLATVHWVARHENAKALDDPAVAVQEVRNWSDHKRRLFPEDHIHRAWSTLKEKGWLNPN